MLVDKKTKKQSKELLFVRFTFNKVMQPAKTKSDLQAVEHMSELTLNVTKKIRATLQKLTR